MGQAQCSTIEEDSCFRACLKQKKGNSKKNQALPQYRQKQEQHARKQALNVGNSLNCNAERVEQGRGGKTVRQQFETSLDQHLFTEDMRVNKKNLMQHSTNIVTIEPREVKIVEWRSDPAKEITLGMQSKIIHNPNDRNVSAEKNPPAKTNTCCEATSPRPRCFSNEKDPGSQGETTSKSNRTSSSTQSRNILLNKIQSIKQKYFERELEIEIYQDEREYQEQIDQINQIERTFTLDHSCLPEQSLGQIKAIRDKILKKLRAKKGNKMQEGINQDQAFNFNLDKQTVAHDQLEIYSREGRTFFEDTLNDSLRIKHSKLLRNDLSIRGRTELNRSLKSNLAEVSLDEKITFSQFSEKSLHEIRELDEEYEDYKSKMVAQSGLNKNPSYSGRSQRKSQPSEQKLDGILNRVSKLQSKEANQPKITLKQSYSRQYVCKSPIRDDLAMRVKCEQIQGVHYSQDNKILLF